MIVKKKEILIFLACLFIWLLVQFVYSKFVGSLADQNKYLLDGVGEASIFSNTYLMKRFYQLIQIFLPGKIAALLPLTFTAIFIYRSIRIFYYRLTRNEKLIVLSILFLPHFWIWQAVASKEGLIIPLSLIFVYYFSKKVFLGTSFKENLYLFISFLGIFFLKFTLVPAYLFLTCSYFFDSLVSLIKELKRYLFGSFNYYSLIWIGLISSLSAIVLKFFKYEFIKNIEFIMLISSLHLLQTKDANTSRYDFDLSNYLDFFKNMSWGLPASLLGFLPNELENNPIYILLFIEGLFLVVLLIITQLSLFSLSQKEIKVRFIYFFGILPAVIYLIFVNYSSGIYNAGTSIRYKQNILPILLYLPIYILGFYRLRLHKKQIKSEILLK